MQRDCHGYDLVAAGIGVAGRAYFDRAHGNQTLFWQLVLFVQVAAHGARANGDHHVIHRSPGFVFDGLDFIQAECHAFENPVLREHGIETGARYEFGRTSIELANGLN